MSWSWSPERRQVDLAVDQIQADLPFENDFRLPVDVEVVTAEDAALHTVELEGWQTRVSLPAASRPRRVVFDKGNWLVAEVAYARPLEEVLDQLAAGDPMSVRSIAAPVSSPSGRASDRGWPVPARRVGEPDGYRT